MTRMYILVSFVLVYFALELVSTDYTVIIVCCFLSIYTYIHIFT